MPARQGSEHHHSGPHLPGTPKVGPRHFGPHPGEEPFDPTNGSCFNCGERAGVMDFELVLYRRSAGRWLLCEPCWRWGNRPEPRDADPLDVTAA